MKYNRFRYKYWRFINWYLTGQFIWDGLWNWWHVRIAKKPPVWPEADQESCNLRFCRYCGKGSK